MKDKLNDVFEITLSDNWSIDKDIIINDLFYYKYKGKILNKPKKKWYKILFQFLSFGLYKAPYEYKIKII